MREHLVQTFHSYYSTIHQQCTDLCIRQINPLTELEKQCLTNCYKRINIANSEYLRAIMKLQHL